jgi:hypothetical protein
MTETGAWSQPERSSSRGKRSLMDVYKHPIKDQHDDQDVLHGRLPDNGPRAA